MTPGIPDERTIEDHVSGFALQSSPSLSVKLD